MAEQTINSNYFEKYKDEFYYLYCAKILNPETWQKAKCSEAIRVVGAIIAASDKPKLLPFKQMFQNPIEYINKEEITPQGLVAEVTDGMAKIVLRLTLKEAPDFSRFGINNYICRFPGQDEPDFKTRTINYMQWIIEQFSVKQYMDMVEAEIAEISFH